MRKLVPIVPILLAFLGGCAAAASSEGLKSTFDSGVAAYDRGDYQTAFKLWSSIDDDDVAAMRNVAMLERQGLGTKKDPKAAELMFERAAEAGLPTAQADLADMLLKGEAGPPDPERALPLLQAAAAANHPVAQYQLAQMYEAGTLVPRNIQVARNLYAAAASHGMKEAQDRLDALGPPSPGENGAPGEPQIPGPPLQSSSIRPAAP
jgi:TPR repeat protein